MSTCCCARRGCSTTRPIALSSACVADSTAPRWSRHQR
jgi:hypothetical protein